jgi:hypothetical protein
MVITTDSVLVLLLHLALRLPVLFWLTTNPGDCDDNNAADVNPAATEICNPAA